MQNRHQRDLELWHEARKKRFQDPSTLNALLHELNPIIQKEVGKWGSTVPRPALESKARMLTVDALKKYDPNRGAAVATHVTSQIRKLSRHVYPYQNVARLPENKQLNYNAFQIAQNRLVDTLGRDPTVDEMADQLGWPQRKVTDFQHSFARRELVESEGAYIEGDETQEPVVDFYYHGLSPTNRRLFEDITGYNNQRPMTNQQLMRKHQLTQGQLSYRKRKFTNDLQRIQRGQY